MRIIEFRTYRLKPGTPQAFERVMRGEALPLLERHGLDVLRFSVSLVPDEHTEPDAMLVRAFGDLDERDRQEDAFYGSHDWIDGPRADVRRCIETFHTVVVEASAEAAERLREADH